MVKIPVGSRKIQKAANRSYFLNLPLWWVKQLGLSKGDKIDIYRSKSGSLLLKPDYNCQDKAIATPLESDEEKRSTDVFSRLSQLVSKQL